MYCMPELIILGVVRQIFHRKCVILRLYFSMDEVTVMTTFVTVGCVLLLGFFLMTMANLEEERLQGQTPPREKVSKGSTPSKHEHQHHQHQHHHQQQEEDVANVAPSKEVR